MVNSNKEDYRFDSTYDDDIYRIDTTKLNNKWYNDPNFDDGLHLITFDKIPLNAIKLIYKSSFTLDESLRKFIATTIPEYLNESSESDIKANMEAKRIYNKIKRNIQKINFTPSPNEEESYFVKDSRGNIHTLKGVKFNLNELGEDYDLDIFLVNTIGKGSNHHYDGNANRIVFFIITQTENPLDFENNSHIARLRFSSWVDEKVFIHEFIHFLDKNKYKDTYSFKTPKNDDEYYNSPEEYNAYSQEIINKILQNKSKLIGISFDSFLYKSFKFGSKEFINNLNGDYMKKLKNRLYKIYNEINSVGEK